jgi:cytochrome c
VRLALALAFVALLPGGAPAAAPAAAPAFRVLAFTKTAGYRHVSIPAAIQAIENLGAQNGFALDNTEDGGAFTDASLARYRVVIFLLTTGDVLDDQQQAALERFIRAGGGFVGVHSAADTEYGWAWYGGLLGAYFMSHPAIQQATIAVTDAADPSTVALPRVWVRTDEWYDFQSNPRSVAHVLATIDEKSYDPGPDAMGADHPIAWSHQYEGGRAWYTAGGHTEEAWSEPLFLAHVLGGIEWAAGPLPATTPSSPTPAAEPAPKIVSLATALHGRRVVVTVRHPSCSCEAVLGVRVRGRLLTTRVVANRTTTRASSAVLPPGRWQLTFTLTSRTGAASATARRWVRVH